MQLHTPRHRAYRTSHNLPSGCHTTRRPDIATSQLAVVVTQLCTTHGRANTIFRNRDWASASYVKF